jgi:hypothetical protein
MKTIPLTLLTTLCATGLLAQGTIQFNNNLPGLVVTHVYSPLAPALSVEGNGPNDTPPGNQDYSGMVLAAGPGYSAQLWATSGMDNVESSLWSALPITTFRTGAEAGFVEPVTATLSHVPADSPVASVQLRVWDNRGGTIDSWFMAEQVDAARGRSPVFNVARIGGVVYVPPDLVGLQSFSLYAVPEPATGALFGLGFGCAVLAVFRRAR